MLDGILQDNFLTVKMVKQILPEESYAYQISYTLQFLCKCDFQQKQHMSSRFFFFQALQLYNLHFTLVHICIHSKGLFCRLTLNRNIRFKVQVTNLCNTNHLKSSLRSTPKHNPGSSSAGMCCLGRAMGPLTSGILRTHLVIAQGNLLEVL